jgi:hypothetical protein
MSKPTNEPEEDFLSEDPEIPSQKYVLLSFLSPEKILKNKDVFFFTQFVKDYEVQWKTSKLEAWLAERVMEINSKLDTLAGELDKKDLSGAAVEVRKNLLRTERLVEEFQEYTRKSTKEIKESTIQDEYETFIFKQSEKLEDEFFKQNDFHTTMRGCKVRGVYSTEGEAVARAKRLQKSDPNFNIYMGLVGKWMAWEPDPNKVGTQEYANEQLNTLMKKYRENEEHREVFYNEQKKARIGNAKTKATAEADQAATDATKVSESVPALGFATGSEQYGGLFSGPADLAIQRKMEKAEKKDE